VNWYSIGPHGVLATGTRNPPAVGREGSRQRPDPRTRVAAGDPAAAVKRVRITLLGGAD